MAQYCTTWCIERFPQKSSPGLLLFTLFHINVSSGLEKSFINCEEDTKEVSAASTLEA